MDNSTKRKTNKLALIFCAIAVAIFAIVICIPSDDDKSLATNAIPVNPTEYSLSCENMGFSVSDTFDEENGHLWTCTRSNIGINETVTILSKDMESTESVRITVQLESDKKPEASLMVFKRMTTIPYEGNSDENCQRMQQWIEDNLNNDKASEIFDGGVQLTIYAPSDFVRMMDISKAQ